MASLAIGCRCTALRRTSEAVRTCGSGRQPPASKYEAAKATTLPMTTRRPNRITDWTGISAVPDWRHVLVARRNQMFRPGREKVADLQIDAPAVAQATPSFRTDPELSRSVLACRSGRPTAAQGRAAVWSHRPAQLAQRTEPGPCRPRRPRCRTAEGSVGSARLSDASTGSLAASWTCVGPIGLGRVVGGVAVPCAGAPKAVSRCPDPRARPQGCARLRRVRCGDMRLEGRGPRPASTVAGRPGAPQMQPMQGPPFRSRSRPCCLTTRPVPMVCGDGRSSEHRSQPIPSIISLNLPDEP